MERFSGLILGRIRRSDGTLADEDRRYLQDEFSKVERAGSPLMARLPEADASLFEAMS